eukprot:6812509-Pyramimonas_sp.AAC.1
MSSRMFHTSGLKPLTCPGCERRDAQYQDRHIPVGLERLAPAPGIYPLVSRDWPPLQVYTRWSHATGSRSGNIPVLVASGEAHNLAH